MTAQGDALEHPSHHQPPPSPIARPTSLDKVLEAAHAGPSLGRKAGIGFNSVSLPQADGVLLSPACSTYASPSSPARHTTRCAKWSGNSQAIPAVMVDASKSDSYNCVDVAARDGGVSLISYISGVEVHSPLRTCSLCADANVSDSTLLHIEPQCHRGSRRASTSLKGTGQRCSQCLCLPHMILVHHASYLLSCTPVDASPSSRLPVNAQRCHPVDDPGLTRPSTSWRPRLHHCEHSL